MPSKTISPEAAQRKAWQTEIRDLEKSSRKIASEFSKARADARRRVAQARKNLQIIDAKATKEIAQLDKREPKAVADINHRIAILRGRLGQ